MKKFFLAALLFSCLLTGCAGAPAVQSSADSAPAVAVPAVSAPPAVSTAIAPEAKDEPYWPTAGWRTSTPEKHGMDSVRLAAYVQEVKKAGGIRCCVLIRDGYILMEYYADDAAKEYSQVYSVTKSVVSAAFGMAQSDGKIKGVDRKVLDFFRDKEIANLDERKKSLTLKHFLTMSAGLDWPASESEVFRQLNGSDRCKAVLDRPVAEKPGTVFAYDNGLTQVVSEVVERATGEQINQYVHERLFEPAGISDYKWDKFYDGDIKGYMGLNLTARDMAKLGYLYLKMGNWDGRQIVPVEWVEESTVKKITAATVNDVTDGYGYYWWTDADGNYSARGYLGQYIEVFPRENIVVVYKSELYGKDEEIPLRLAKNHVLPAVVSDKALPPNDAAYASLMELCK
jgi:CubicO group peptidase (beta-lactamase class C family)